MSQGKILLMACGSFSPPTYMHLRMFEIARDYIQTLNMGTVVGGLVSPVHDAYGKKDLVGAQHRLSMLRLALRSSDWIKVSDWETQQSEWTRTRLSMQYHQDTVNHYINNQLPDPPSWLPDDVIVNNIDEPDNLIEKLNGNINNYYMTKVQVKLLCGADLLESFATPGLWSNEDMEAILGRFGLVVVSRSGSDPGRFIYESDMLYKYRNNIILVTNYITNEVSSTVLRRLMRRGESTKYLTDDSVITYIRQHRLYGANTNDNTEYSYLNNIANYDKRSPQDVVMVTPEETNFKNILISIRDRPSLTDEVLVKRPKKSNFLKPNSHTDSISPIVNLEPKMAYTEKFPGKAVKIQDTRIVTDDKVSDYNSLESYLSKDEFDTELFKRRVSAGNVEIVPNVSNSPVKKRCSASTIRKLTKKNTDVVKKSRSEVSRLCEKMKNVKLKEKESGKNYKTRSCNDIVKLVLTKHGIHVISDTEAIV